MSRDINRIDVLQLKIPLQRRVAEGRDEPASSGVDVDGDVEAGALLEVVDCGWAMR